MLPKTDNANVDAGDNDDALEAAVAEAAGKPMSSRAPRGKLSAKQAPDLDLTVFDETDEEAAAMESDQSDSDEDVDADTVDHIEIVGAAPGRAAASPSRESGAAAAFMNHDCSVIN